LPPRERGAALLAVLLLVTVMGALTTIALERLRLSTSLAGNVVALDQARTFAIGIESLTTLTIDDLLARSSERTTLEGGWNGARRRLPMPGGAVAEAVVRDGGNCFNINSLASFAPPATFLPRPSGMSQFQALMVLIGIPEGAAGPIAEAAGDWIDSDAAPNRQGAEDPQYAGAQQGYRTGNTMFSEVSELRAVSGMTPEIYTRLRPWVCALPTTDLSPINVNTLAPEQAPLLAMLGPQQIGVDAVRGVLAARPQQGWNSMTDFWVQFQGINLPFDVQLQPQLRTRWFSLDVLVELEGAELQETALIDARLAPAKVVARRWGSEE
jgi:general secretion pathway protein K